MNQSMNIPAGFNMEYECVLYSDLVLQLRNNGERDRKKEKKKWKMKRNITEGTCVFLFVWRVEN